MGALLAFLRRNSLEILFLLLQVLAFTILVHHKRFHRAHWLNKTAQWNHSILQRQQSVLDYFSLRGQNEVLQRENARLRSALRDAYILDVPLHIPIQDSMLARQYRYFPAQAIHRSFRKSNNVIVLDKGSKHGVYQGMGVMGPQGVVGMVRDVQHRYATVLSILHSNSRLSVKIKSNHFFGTMLWDGRNFRFAQISDLPPHVEISIGDTIVTDARSAIFPAGLPVGVVESFQHIKESDQVQAEVRLLTDFSKLNTVYLIEDMFLGDREEVQRMIETVP